MSDFTREVYITCQFEACHFWADAPLRVGFLRSMHRHIFHVVCGAPVSHNDRDIEFICLKQDVQQFCNAEFQSKYDIGQTSCEMIAERILTRFKELTWVQVSEDGENGAIVRRNQ